MSEFKKFITQFRCKTGESYTHTSIDDPKGSFKIPEESINEFYNVYNRSMMQGTMLYMTEKPTDPSPMRLDLDFRFSIEKNDDGEIIRKYNESHIITILNTYNSLLEKYIDINKFGREWKAYVMEKPKPVESRGKCKDGIHIIWPNVILSHSMQHLIRKHILNVANEMFKGLSMSNTFEDIIDKAIIDKNNWQMYGSRKPDCESYRVTKVYGYTCAVGGASGSVGSAGAAGAGGAGGVLELCTTPAPSEELEFPLLFSMRNKGNHVTPILPEKDVELEEYIRHIVPTMDDKRKSKLDFYIFGKNQNNSRNLTNDEDFNMAKQLVEECLLPTRAENYEDWIKLGWTLRNIDFRLLDTWINFSRVSNKYVEGECQKMWNRMKNDTLGMGTLRWWTRNDNPKQYEAILRNNVEILIDKCIGSDGAHYDIAMVIHTIYKDRYRFTSKDTWYMFADEKHKWVRSKEGLKLRNILSTDICSRFMRRSMYWTEKARSAEDDDSREKCESKSKKLLTISVKLKTAGYKDSVLKECKELFTDENFEELLDSHAHLLGFENGVYDLRMGEFRDGLPDDYISFSTNRHYVDFDKNSEEAKEIEKYLSQVFVNENVRKYMKDIMACMIDGGIRQEKFYIYTGNGSNSKSALLNLVQKAIGDYYCILPIALLTQKRAASNSAQSELERTKGRRIAVMQEPGENEKLNIGLMKELSGGDRIMTRALFKEPIEFRPQFKMIMTCNELPEVPSDDGGTWRRIRVIEYKSKFTDSPDPNNPLEFPLDGELLDKFEKWADIFISMLIHHHGTMDFKKIHEPEEVRLATEGYKKNNDLIGQYINERLEKDEESKDRVIVTKLYGDFRGWAFNIVPKGKLPDRNQFRANVEKVFGVYPTNGKGWKGIVYKSSGGENNNSDVD